MRKAVFALTAVLAIFLLMEPLVQVAMVKAIWPYFYIYFYSPRPSLEEIYQNTTLPLTIDVGVWKDSPEINSISYSLDGNDNCTLFFSKKSDAVYSASGILANLAEGNHNLKVSAFDVNGGVVISEQETFTVDTTFSYPTVTIISPLNQTYSKNEVPLTYTIDAKVMRAFYTLDNFDKAFSGNITLTELSEGPHKLSVSVLNEDYKYAQETIYFTIAKEIEPQLDSFPILPVTASIATVAIVSIGVLVYFKKHKH